MIPFKRSLRPSKRLFDPNQAAQHLKAHKVKLTWKDLYIDYRNYRRAYYFIPHKKTPRIPKVEVEASKFSLIQYAKELFEEKNMTEMRQMYLNVFRALVITLFYLLVQKYRGWKYGWYLEDTLGLSREAAQSQPIQDDIYKEGKQKEWA